MTIRQPTPPLRPPIRSPRPAHSPDKKTTAGAIRNADGEPLLAVLHRARPCLFIHVVYVSNALLDRCEDKADLLERVISKHWPEKISSPEIGSEALAGQVADARTALCEALNLKELG